MWIMVGVGKGARRGVLIKSAEALERMEKVDTLVVDKTGTLTEGKPRVVAVVAGAGMTEADILPLAASLERSSEHPLAAAIVAARARSGGIGLQEPAEFASVTGKGVTGTVGGRRVALGNARLMADLGVDLGALRREADDAAPGRGDRAVPGGRRQGRRASSRSPIRSRRRRRRRWTACARTASASSC